MMDAIPDPLVHEVVIQESTLISYSNTAINNLFGYYIVADPKPIILVQSIMNNAKDYGKKRITPMMESCPTLRARIRP